MISRLGRSKGRAYGVEFIGPVDPGQFTVLLAEIDALVRAHGRINLLCLARGVNDGSSKEFVTRVKNTIKRWSDFGKVALVGGKSWWAAALEGALTNGKDLRRFDEADLERAWAWVER